MLKRTSILAFLMTVFCAGLVAQPGPPGGEKPSEEKMQALKIGFITRELNLTPEESQVFWPVYNKRQEELDAVRKNRREEMGEMKDNFDTMSDQEVEKALDEILEIQQRELDINKKYVTEFKKVISVRKVAKLYAAEKKFRGWLMEQLRDRGGRPGGPGGPPGGGRGPAPRD